MTNLRENSIRTLTSIVLALFFAGYARVTHFKQFIHSF